MLRFNSFLKRVVDDWNLCSRVIVFFVFKESRKRSFVVEDEEDELMRLIKRCLYLYYFLKIWIVFLLK